MSRWFSTLALSLLIACGTPDAELQTSSNKAADPILKTTPAARDLERNDQQRPKDKMVLTAEDLSSHENLAKAFDRQGVAPRRLLVRTSSGTESSQLLERALEVSEIERAKVESLLRQDVLEEMKRLSLVGEELQLAERCEHSCKPLVSDLPLRSTYSCLLAPWF